MNTTPSAIESIQIDVTDLGLEQVQRLGRHALDQALRRVTYQAVHPGETTAGFQASLRPSEYSKDLNAGLASAAPYVHGQLR